MAHDELDAGWGSDRRRDTAMDRIQAQTGLDPERWLDDLQKASQELLNKRRELSGLRAQKVRLEARFGAIGNGSSHWDHQRKTLLAELEVDIRAAAVQEEKTYQAADDETRTRLGKPAKVTDSAVDAATHSHPRYKQFLEESFGERQEYLAYKVDIDRLYGEVEHLQGVREYLIQRIRLNEEAIRHNRSLANLGG